MKPGIRYYRGVFTRSSGYAVTVDRLDANGVCCTRPLRHYMRHSVGGFAWGYDGDAPLELARCLLIEHVGDDDKITIQLYRLLCTDLISRFPERSDWMIAETEIDSLLRAYGRTDLIPAATAMPTTRFAELELEADRSGANGMLRQSSVLERFSELEVEA